MHRMMRVTLKGGVLTEAVFPAVDGILENLRANGYTIVKVVFY